MQSGRVVGACHSREDVRHGLPHGTDSRRAAFSDLREASESSSAHVFQSRMAVRFPLVACFALQWFRRARVVVLRPFPLQLGGARSLLLTAQGLT